MTDPYRDGGYREPVEAPRDAGIVGDVIAQFADPNAFYRELIQNAIDAGSPDIVVSLDYDESQQRMHASVRDRGEGMTREIIEKQLLVLFRSSKENDKTKIGKFGVGFASVLAPNPEVVVVNTSRDGSRLTLHLYRDLTYELFDGGRATQTGTTVELELVMPRDQVPAFEKASEAALRRWCRHASVPIELVTGKERTKVRIDSPLSIEAAHVQVEKTFDNGELTVVAGIPLDGEPYLGFFNHGLMLHETTSQGIGRAAVKVLDSRLGHTISRDDVRRDDHYRHALAVAREVVAKDLAAAASARLRDQAEKSSGPAYCEVLDAIVKAGVRPETWYFPLVDPVGGKKTITHDDLPKRVWVSSSSTPLTQALAGAGVPVLHASRRGAFDGAAEALGLVLADVDFELTVVTHVAQTTQDVALLELLMQLLDAVHRAPETIVLAKVQGFRDDMIAIALPDATTHVLDSDDASKNPFALFGRRMLALSVTHPHVAAAREADNPYLAAAHVARAVLLQYDLLDAKRSRAMLELVLDRLGVEA